MGWSNVVYTAAIKVYDNNKRELDVSHKINSKTSFLQKKLKMIANDYKRFLLVTWSKKSYCVAAVELYARLCHTDKYF